MIVRDVPDSWAEGPAYDRFMGRWSAAMARRFIAWLRLPAGGRWLDAGCGTGALSAAIVELAEPKLVLAFDRSPAYAAHANGRLAQRAVRFFAADTHDLPVAANSFDAVVSGLILNFLADPLRAVVEMRRAARPGGNVALYVWDYAGEMAFLRAFWDAAVALDPAAADLDEGRRFPICQPAPLAHVFDAAGLIDVNTTALHIPTPFADFDDFWEPFLGGQGPAPGYVVALDAARRAALRDALQERLPTREDGRIELSARAWAVRGRRPG